MTILNRRRYRLLKVLALLSQIRWYNIALAIVGQYLAAVFVFEAPGHRRATLLDPGSHWTIWSSVFILIFGFLINCFYDLESDQINRPKQTAFERLISQNTSFRIAMLSLTIGLLMAFSVSGKAALFYGIFALGLWYYSHRLKRIPLIGHLSASVLALMPFFGISVYHHYFSWHTIAFGSLLGLTLFSRELLKDLMMYKGDLIVGRPTVLSEYGPVKTRFALMVTTTLAWVPAFFTQHWYTPTAKIGLVAILLCLSISNLITLGTENPRGLRWAHLGYKVILILGVLTIPYL